MRVALDARLEYGRGGGVQQGIVAIVRALGAARPEDIELSIATLADRDEWVAAIAPDAPRHPQALGRARRLARRIERLPFGPALIEMGIERQRRNPVADGSGLFESLDVDAVHFPFQHAELTSVPFLYHPWDLQHRHLPHLFPESEREARDRRYGAYCRAARIVVAPTQAVADDVVGSFDLDPEKVVVVPPWAPSGRPSGTDEAPIPRCVEGPYLLYPAQAWAHKNHEALIDAAAILRARGQNIRIVCSGATNERVAGLVDHARRAGVDDQLCFPGYVDDETIRSLFRHASALVFPSLFEGWGYPVVEAMEAGIPVACSDIEWLDDAAGSAALRFDPRSPEAIAAAVAEVLEPGVAAELVALGRAHVRQWSWVAIGERYAALYRRVSA